MSNCLVSAFSATGQSATFQPYAERSASQFNMSLYGTFVGTVQLERSFDKGLTWLPITALGYSISFTAPCSEVFEEPEFLVFYRLNCTAYTSGTIKYRLSN